VPEDQSVKIILGVLGGLYGAAAISAFLFIVLPRLLARQAGQAARLAARPAVGLPRMFRAARSRPTGLQGLRWSPSYSRARPGPYVSRQQVALQRAAPRPAFPDRIFTVPDTVRIPL